MLKGLYLTGCANLALAAIAAGPARAQVVLPPPGAETAESTQSPSEPEEPEIVVTGSLIRGTREDSAVPVNVIGADEMSRQGTPSLVELFRALPTASGNIGESNQFDGRSQGAEGLATVNLRGLGPNRTLVLLNSKRLATAGNAVPAVDLNLLPLAALSRIEILKDGASATYGSEAVAGVVNFITRTNQEGLATAASYKFVDDAGGDFDASLSYGHKGDGFRVLVAAGLAKRGELLARERDWARRPYAENPQGGWSTAGNPSSFVPLAPTGAPVGGLRPDTGCATLSGYVGANGICYGRYTDYLNLAEYEKRGTVFIDVAADLSARTELKVTALYGKSTAPHVHGSPTSLLAKAPSLVALGGTNPTPFIPGFYVPAANPGFSAYRAANPGAVPAVASGAVFPLLLFRPLLAGGNPAFPELGGASRQTRRSESIRLTADLTHRITPDIDLAVGLTYNKYSRYVSLYDSLGDRVQLALRGLGGPSCNVSANLPGQNGCQWFNPFSNAVAVNPATGATNPQAIPALANSADLVRWFYVPFTLAVDTQIAVADSTVSGQTGLRLPGGEVTFAVGGQYRHNWFDTRNGTNNDLAVTPCRETPINGNVNAAACAPSSNGGPPAAATGPFGFFGSGRNSSLDGGVYAVFAELQVPIVDRVQVQLAARYEDYGRSGGGSTFDPQVRARAQLTDWLALRGGYASTFRAPPPANLVNVNSTLLQVIGAAFKPVDVAGNPNLKPETSDNFSGGAIVTAGGLTASIDYYRYRLRGAIVTDPLAAIVATLFPAAGGNRCALYPALAARFTFDTGACTTTSTVANVSRAQIAYQNAATIVNSGLDLQLDYRSNDDLIPGVRLGFGTTVNRTLEEKVSAISVAGVSVSQPFDGAGLLNYQTTIYPLPKWKGQGYLDLGTGPVDMRLTVNYTGGLHDQRADRRVGPFAPDTSVAIPGATLLQGADIKSFTSVDLSARLRLVSGVTLTASVYNLFDRDPPFAREDYNYEPLVGNPFGRMIKVGVSITP